MCSWRILYISVPILIGFYITEYRKDILNLLRLQSDTSTFFDDKLDLFIYIPSARENSHKRQAIRDTWASAINATSTLPVTLRFVVGKNACGVHKDYRREEYACEEWFLPHLTEVNEKTRHAIKIITRNKTSDLEKNSNSKNKENNNLDKNNYKNDVHGGDDDSVHGGDDDSVNGGDDDEDEDGVYPVQRIEFTVHHELLLVRLGVHDVCMTGGSVVRMLEPVSMKEIVSVTFDATKLHSSAPSSSFNFKNLDNPYILPKGFKGVLLVENLESANKRCVFKFWDFPLETIYNSSNVIEFSEPPIIPTGHYLGDDQWGSRPFAVVNFAYKLFATSELKEKISRRDLVHSELKKNITLEDSSLQQESSQYGDMMFVDVVDVYRNLPRKFLLFAKVMVESEAKMVLKVDDDSYLDLQAVLKVIQSIDYRHNVWLGRFRHNWPINMYGKWADHHYTSFTYPRFACGSGYILTQGLVKWIAKSSDSLKIYQGEDVSMGIWLSAVEHKIIDNPLWQCDKECISDMYNMPDLRPDLLKAHWKAKVKCGDPCGCD